MNDDFIFHDENEYFTLKKESRQARKRARKQDRSKYKKTDLGKRTQPPTKQPSSLKRGLVLRIRPQQFFVFSDDAITVCSLRGSLKKETTKQKNLVIVGDYVWFEPVDTEGVIHSVEERKSVLSRADHLSQQKEHFIAANVDQVFITISVLDPPLRAPIIDRYLIAANKGNLHPIIVCNKIDLLDSPDYEEDERQEARQTLYECEKIYQSIGYPFLLVSAKTDIGIDQLRACMKDRISVFSGQSGSGKSSIINAATGLELKVGKTVSRTRKGSHTTSSAELLELAFGGWCIDTPGIKSFGVWDLQKEDLSYYFVEINQEAINCKFPNCHHRGEPGCAIPLAIEEGRISGLRYESYLSLLSQLKQEHLRR
jgi:ribosome biogenesis GTPase / thiamine phosphate phosphatase